LERLAKKARFEETGADGTCSSIVRNARLIVVNEES